MNAGEQSNVSSEVPLTNGSSTTSATVVKELTQSVDYLSIDNQSITIEQTGTKNKGWLSKSQRITIENSWKRATKVSNLLFMLAYRIKRTKLWNFSGKIVLFEKKTILFFVYFYY